MTRVVRLILGVALALTSLAALLAAAPLLTYGADRAQWFVRPAPPAEGASATSARPKWIVSTRDARRIVDVASIGRAPQQLASFGDRLVILAGDGSWWLASRDGGVVAGPRLPNDRRPLAIAAGRGLLWFLVAGGGGDDGARSLTTWDGHSFADAGRVPDVRPPAVDARLLVTRDATIVASRLLDGLHLATRVGDAWRVADGRIDADAAWLVQDERRGPLLIARRGVDWSVRAIARDGTPGAATPLAAGDVPREASASIVDGDVRLSWSDGGQVVERAFDPANRAVGAPTRIRPTAGTRAPGTFDRVASWISMAAIALLLLTAGRARPPAEARGKRDDADATPVPAALARRLAAGLVDAWPLYASCVAVVLTSGRVGDELVHLDATRDRLIVIAGALAYVVVNFLCERRWQRTPGKLLFGLRVVADGTGAPPTARAVLIRNVLRLLDLNLVTLLIVPLSRQRQRLGDLIANTIVVDARADEPKGGGGTEVKR